MGVCKSRAQAPTTVTEPSMPDISAVQANGKPKAAFDGDNAKQKLASPITMPLPTSSWRALLKEQPLNADAKPFTPTAETFPPPVQKAQSKAFTPADLAAQGAPVACNDDPEWMQYLSKRLQAPTQPRGEMRSERTATQTNGKKASGGVGGSIAGRALGGGGEGPGASACHSVIHTEAYLKLLKEGSSKKKTSNFSNARRTATRTPAISGKGSLADGSSMLQIAQAVKENEPMPITTSGLASKWSSAVGEQKDAVEEVVNRSTQDDMWIGKLLVDQDLSDPAYYSETDAVDPKKSSASVHRLWRRPKTNGATIRSYVMQDMNFYLDRAIGTMLLRLQRFTDQQKSLYGCHDGNDAVVQSQQQRRFVIGLKEVARRTKQGKLECVIIAPDIEEDGHSGGLDDRMRELIASAYQNGTPVIFALSRARLGKALGKSLHISVLGVLDARGARALLAESKRLAAEGQQTWLARLEK